MNNNNTVGEMCCRACGAKELKTVVDLGITPLSNAFVPFARAAEGEVAYPLHAFVCEKCFLVQLGEFEEPSTIFSNDYVYFSSYSTSWVEHAKRYADEMTKRFSLGKDAHIAEIASNDGYLLQWFQKSGYKVTGVEPAGNCAEAARTRGVETISEFFGIETAKNIVSRRGCADLIAANNVLAHVPDIIDFVGGFKEFLKADGIATFEFPHLQNLIEKKQFDTIYHEHFSYLALAPLMPVMQKAGLRVFDVQTLSTHGGSLRLFVCHEDSRHKSYQSVDDMIAQENEAGLYDLQTYESFAEDVRNIKDELLSFLIEARRQGKSVAAYGAAAKGSTLLNYCGIGPEYVSYVVDKNPAKQNSMMPGVRIPVFNIEHMETTQPDFVLILPWNLRNEIATQLREESALKSKFVTALPSLEVF